MKDDPDLIIIFVLAGLGIASLAANVWLVWVIAS